MPKAAAKLQMLAEQGYICAYTMQAMQMADDCHIEHVVPRNQPNQPLNLDIDYNNMLACFPGRKPPPGLESKISIRSTGKRWNANR